MDERLQRALEHGRLRKTIAVQTQIAKETYETQLLFNFDKGLFRATQNNLTYWNMLFEKYQNDIIILDDKMKPIQITNFEFFLNTAFDIHHQANNYYFNELEKLKKARNVKQATDVE